jgi:hypothetical protein
MLIAGVMLIQGNAAESADSTCKIMPGEAGIDLPLP